MRRLHVDQTVTVSLDEESQSIPCRVHEVQGAVSRLAYRGEIPPRLVGRLVTGSAGYVLFDEFGAAVGLRVAVRARPPYLDVALIDGIAVAERRGGDRVMLVTRARIVRTKADADTETETETVDAWTHTINVSERGALLRDHPELGNESFVLELMFGDDPRPITAQARVARRVDDAVGVAFESIASDDARRLQEYLAGVKLQRSSAERVPAAELTRLSAN
jgi:PilZ domain